MVSISDRNLINATIPMAEQLIGEGSGPTRALTIVNGGTLAVAGTMLNNNYRLLAAIYAGTADVINNGTIAVVSDAGRYYIAFGIFGSKTITNNGTISLTGNGTAISGGRDIVNSGTITDVAGSGATSINGLTEPTNSGTIRVDGVAVQSGYYSSTSLINSGAIESRKATAVMLGYGGRLTNEATGTNRHRPIRRK